jgi:hypothetical protein
MFEEFYMPEFDANYINGIGSPMLGAETVGFDLANPMLGGPEQGGSYTGGIGGGSSRTEAERQAAILDVNPYVAPSEDMSLAPVTSQRNGNQPGYYFANELGLPARYGDVGSPQPADPATFDPNAQYVAPMPGFVPVDPNATYRLVNGGTGGDVVYSGAGEEGLRNVFEQANRLTLDDPKNAYWGVEVLDPDTGEFERVAENQGPNGLGIVGDIAGVALPIAAAIATGGASLGVQIAAGAAAGGLGGFLSGKDILKSALIAGATAGIGNVSGFNDAVGGVITDASKSVTDAFAGAAAKEAAKQAAAEQIVVTGLGNLAKGTASGVLQGATSGLTSGLSQTPPQQPTVQKPSDAPVDETIVVSAKPAVSGSGSPFAAAVPVPVEAILNGTLVQPTPSPEPVTEEAVTEEPKEEIVVSAYRPINPVGGFDPTSVSKDIAGIGGSVAAGLPAITELAMDPTLAEPAVEDIVVSGNRPVPRTVVPDELAAIGAVLPALGIPEVPTPDPALTDRKSILEKAGDVADLAQVAIPVIGGVVGGGGDGGTIAPDTTGLNFTKSPLRPTLTGSGIGGTGSRYPYTPQTYGRAGGNQETEYLFFTRDPATGEAAVVPGKKEGGEIEDDMVKHLVEYHKNGGHQGPGQVKGIGSGQDDKIPAWLSDGEYVWSAQDVADLGDGSTDEGVRRLDKMRQMVRQQAGRKDVKKIAKPQKGIDRMLKAVGGMV